MKVKHVGTRSVIVQHFEWYPGETREIHPGVLEGLKAKSPGVFVEVGQPAVASVQSAERPAAEAPSQGMQSLTPALPRSAGEGDQEVTNVDDAGGAGKPAGKRSGSTRRRAKR